MSPRPCPACGALAAEELLATRAASEADGTAFRVVRCTACGLQLTRPLPTESEIAELYGHQYYGEGCPGLLSWERLRLLFHEVVLRHRALALAGRPPGRALDVGCGDGDMLAFLRARGWEVRGQDLSPAAAARAAAKGIEVHLGPLSGAPYEAGSFDVVMLWHVLEHLTEPLEELRRIRGLLAPEGLLVVEVPNNASWTRRLCGELWFPLDVPRHLQHFTPATLRSLLEKAGFTPRRWTRFHPLDFILSAMSFCDRFRLLGRRQGTHYFMADFRRAGLLVKARFLLFGLPVLLLSAPYSWLAALVGRNGEVVRVVAERDETPRGAVPCP